MSLGQSMYWSIIASLQIGSQSPAPAAQPRMPIFTKGSIMHVTIYAIGNQEMAEEMGNQSQKYIGEFDFSLFNNTLHLFTFQTPNFIIVN